MPPVPELPAGALRWYADPAIFDFPSTAFVKPLSGIIGQERALQALRLGAEIYSPGYNIFVSGLSGTGRSTTIKNILEQITPEWHVPHDYAFVNNFSDESAPRLLTLPRGKGGPFRQALLEAIGYLRTQIPRTFDDEKFRTARAKIIEEYQGREKTLLESFEAQIKPRGFALGQRRTGNMVQPEIMPIVGDQTYAIEQLASLVQEKTISAEEAEGIERNYTELRKELFTIARQGMQLALEFQGELARYEREQAQLVVEATIDDIRGRFPFESVSHYLDEVQEDVLDRLDLFKGRQIPMATAPARGEIEEEEAEVEEEVEEETEESIDEMFRVYAVNVVLDNSKTTGCPVIIETTPTFINLFGTIERVLDQQAGVWTTDFTRIRGGSLLRADGGYLIINAADALSEPGVWKALKRVLLHRKLEIQQIESFFQTSTPAATAMKPQAIDLNVKIIMVGDAFLYQALYEADEDFRKIFKINSEFDYEITRNNEVLQSYARFIRKVSDEEHLLHFEREAVCAVVEYAVEKAGRSDKISLVFSDIADLLREASFWAERDRAEEVTRFHVEKATREMVERNAMWREKTQASILEGTVMIATDGSRVGQINGLAVYSVGQISFGTPSRITATVAVGKDGIVNIDREVELSGTIHDKGAMILDGFFRHRFAQNRPFMLSASVVFEQSYGGIEGDSASSTEVYALLSALSRVPIRQDLAVTGSVNQWGEIQPIGGVKEKVEGFFEICRRRGLTGRQGVLIPIQNTLDLMLSTEVVEAVQEGRFHIYAIRTIDQGIELLTGREAGEMQSDGSWPADSINALVAQRLVELCDAMKKYGASR